MSKSKITVSHSTAIEAAELLANKLENYDQTSKISYGIINQCKPIRGNRRVKIKVDKGAYHVSVRDVGSIQSLWFYSNAENYIKLIEQAAIDLGYDVQGD